MYCRHTDKRFILKQQRGAALVVALLIFAVCAAIMVSMQREFNLFYRQVGNLVVSDQAQSYLYGAEELARLALKTDDDQDKAKGVSRDDLTELWAKESTPYALDEGGWLMGQLEDLQGRFNLNALKKAGAKRSSSGELELTPAQKQFIRLLMTLEELELTQYHARSITLAISDWLDADDNLSPNGAEDSLYLQRTPGYRAANQYMTSVSELRAIEHITPDIMAVLEPLVTVWPLTGSAVNIHTAKGAVLRSFNADDNLNPLSESEVRQLLQTRAEIGFASVDDFFEQPPFTGKKVEQVKTRATESSAFFLLSATADIAERKTHLYSVLSRDNGQINVLVRAAHHL